MSSTVKFQLFEPVSKDMGEVLQIHNSVFKTQQRLYYYQEILRNPENPFWIAEDTDDSEILGYIACKVQYDKGMVYIASLAEQKDVVGTLPPLIEKAVKQAKKLKAKAIYTHSRKSSTKTREALAYLGFEESVDGKFRDGETKYKYELTFRAGKDKIVKNTKAKRKSIKPLPKPKDKFFKIRVAKNDDVNQVLVLHNEFLKKKRERTYFTTKLGDRGIFLVAEDSNGTIAGYIVGRFERKAGLTKGKYQKINLVSMAVGKEYRGWGIAKALINKFITKAKEQPTVEYIYGHVRGKNESAIKLYKRMGFTLKKQGTYKDDDDIKYQFFMRLRYPSLKPYLTKYQTELKWILVGIGIHEALHLVRD